MENNISISAQKRPATISYEIEANTIVVKFGGDWNIYNNLPKHEDLFNNLDKLNLKELKFRADKLGAWDNSLTSLITKLSLKAKERNFPYMLEESLPLGVINLCKLALTVPAHKDLNKEEESLSLFSIIGRFILNFPKNFTDVLSFIGELCLGLVRFFSGRSSCSLKDILVCTYEVGVEALPIVSLISLLVGLIIAFVGVIQLSMFGAEIYIASLVALGITRIMGAVMTGIVLAGRTGASYAAIIGSMQVNEEVDALVAIGISPEDKLAIPRLIALALMTPILVIYSDLMGILGGFIVGSVILGIDYLEYLTFTKNSLYLTHVMVGIFHGFVFGIIIAITGCYQGLKCKRSAEGVGQATTSAVVNSIIYIVISTSILTIAFNMVGV